MHPNNQLVFAQVNVVNSYLLGQTFLIAGLGKSFSTPVFRTPWQLRVVVALK